VRPVWLGTDGAARGRGGADATADLLRAMQVHSGAFVNHGWENGSQGLAALAPPDGAFASHGWGNGSQGLAALAPPEGGTGHGRAVSEIGGPACQMKDSLPNNFDAENAARLCEASAAAYSECLESPGGRPEDAVVSARSTDTCVRITRTESDLVIAFRGTTDARNWLTDLDCAWDMEDGCRIHRGFARALDSVQGRLGGEIMAARWEGRRVWLAGHSLGGALAMLYGWRYFNAHHELPFAGIYTFGQPRVGNSAFRLIYNSCPELFGSTFRVVHADDIVPRVPWLLGCYRHAGHEVFVSGAGSGRLEFRVDPSLGFKLPFDAVNAVRELRHGKVALLADHHVATYLELFPANIVRPGVGEDASRVCR
jgi:hypothetical protein